MRLICPNCGATYEVPDDVIPEAGRDVQCSSCGHTWFERPGASEAAERAEEPGLAQDAMPDRTEEPEPEYAPDTPVDPEPEPPSEPEVPAEPEPNAADNAGEVAEAAPDDRAHGAQDEAPGWAGEPEETGVDPVAQAEDGAPAPRRQPLSPEAAEILREEVAREQAARRGATLESQPDLGLTEQEDTARSREQEARRNIARLQGEPLAPVSPSGSSRSDLLPDIEEINSSLRPEEEEDAPDSHLTEAERAEKTRRRGFRIGFFLVGGIALIGALVYAQSDRLAAAAPGLAPTLGTYVAQVDEARLWLDLRMQAIIAEESPAE